MNFHVPKGMEKMFYLKTFSYLALLELLLALGPASLPPGCGGGVVRRGERVGGGGGLGEGGDEEGL